MAIDGYFNQNNDTSNNIQHRNCMCLGELVVVDVFQWASQCKFNISLITHVNHFKGDYHVKERGKKACHYPLSSIAM